jgi:hypothetical protein
VAETLWVTLGSHVRPKFTTHYRYVECLRRLSANLTATCNKGPAVSKAEIASAGDKFRLIELTWRSIMQERTIVAADSEYSTAAVLWLPVKAYYLLYHILSSMEFMLSGERANLRMSHADCLKEFAHRLRRGELVFSEARFNAVFDHRILQFTEPSGAHLSARATDDVVFPLIMKKIGLYKIEYYKRNAKLNMRKAQDRAKLKEYIASPKFTVSIFDFFYFMRIKSSYRDFNFINDVPAARTAEYFGAYYQTADNFYQAFRGLGNQLVAAISR